METAKSAKTKFMVINNRTNLGHGKIYFYNLGSCTFFDKMYLIDRLNKITYYLDSAQDLWFVICETGTLPPANPNAPPHTPSILPLSIFLFIYHILEDAPFNAWYSSCLCEPACTLMWPIGLYIFSLMPMLWKVNTDVHMWKLRCLHSPLTQAGHFEER